MSEPETIGVPERLGPANASETFQKPWFCAAISASGGIYKSDAEVPSQFLYVLKESGIAWVDRWTDDFENDAPVAAVQLGFSQALVSSMMGSAYTTYQDFETEMAIKLPSIQVRGFEVQAHPLLIFLSSNLVLTIHPRHVDRRFIRLRRYSDTVLKKIRVDVPASDKLTLLLMRIIDETNERNFEHLRQIEEQGDGLNKDMMDIKMPREALGPKIYNMKHALITYLNALWQTVDVLHTLRYGDAELITDNPKLLYRLNLLTEDVSRQIGLAEHLSEVLASGLEVLQSIYNNQLQALNNRLALVMTYLTVIGTAVLVPNTLATIFSSSAFDMQPDDVGWYVALLVVSTIVATGLAYWWVRRGGWLPKKMD
ncbi:MAG: magnesium transporter CorA [Chloroflexi bacterium]|nr:magnesium transporter CorA [Chloroflexota bacterium]